MSYSIPIAEDLGPSFGKGADGNVEFIADESSLTPTVIAKHDNSYSVDTNLLSPVANNKRDQTINKRNNMPAIRGFKLKSEGEESLSKEIVPQFVVVDKLENIRAIHRHSKRGLSEFQVKFDRDRDTSQVSSISSQLIGSTVPNGLESARRDVVSVSQCCNMMETEDVSRNKFV